MKSLVLTAVLAGAVAGGGAAIVASAVLNDSSPESEPAALAPGDTLPDDVAGELRDVREKNEALTQRMAELEMQLSRLRAEQQRSPAVETAPAVAAEELEELVAALRDPSAPPPANFQESVGRALESIREQEERERDERRQEQYVERLDERLSELALELGLSSGQKNDLRDLYTDMSQRQREMMDKARELDDWGSMRDQFRTLRDEMETGLARVMSPAQLARYEELGGDDRRRGGWGGGFLPPSTNEDQGRGFGGGPGGRTDGGGGGDRRRGG